MLNHAFYALKGLYKKNWEVGNEHSNFSFCPTRSSWSELKLEEQFYFHYLKYFGLYLQERVLNTNFTLGLQLDKQLSNKEEKTMTSNVYSTKATLNGV